MVDMKKIFGFTEERDSYQSFINELKAHQERLANVVRRHELLLNGSLIRATLKYSLRGDEQEFSIPAVLVEQAKVAALEIITKEIKETRDRIDNIIHNESDRRK